MKKFFNFLMLSIVATTMLSCDSELWDDESSDDDYSSGLVDDYPDPGNQGGGGSGSGIYNGSKPTGQYWRRNDGMGTAYLLLSGSTAKACSGGKETVGYFNASKPSMTFTIGSDVIEFPLLFANGNLYVGVPDQAVYTNSETQYVATSTYSCGSGSGGGSGSIGGGSGSGGGGSSTGEAMFWTNTDQGCGNITVTINGQSRIISSYYSSGVPDCGASGCGNFSLPAGTYSFTASCTDYQWSGTITVSNGGCSTMKLN